MSEVSGYPERRGPAINRICVQTLWETNLGHPEVNRPAARYKPVDSIHQMYCTHCTYGSSALERRTGATKDDALGYSAKASSFEQSELQKIYRAVEPLLYYSLPADTPAEQKRTRTPQDSPPRLFFFPNTAGLQVAGQVCYRQHDEAGRPGSYFAHLLINRVDQEEVAWNALDCAQWWHAPGWALADDDPNRWVLPLRSADHMLRGARPAISDEALRAFLFGDGDIDLSHTTDPNLIPPRWRAMSADSRLTYFREAMLGYLAAAERTVPALLLVEPSVAALTYFGIARLLPNSMATKLSFSTYEPTAQRLSMSLAAMTFDKPDARNAGDVPADRYSRWFVYNTFSNPAKKSDFERHCPKYLDEVLTIFEAGRSSNGLLEEVLQKYEEKGIREAPNLEITACKRRKVLAAIDKMLEGKPLGDREWSDLDLKDLRTGFVPRLTAAAKRDFAETMDSVGGSPGNVLKIAKLYPSDRVEQGSLVEKALHSLFEDLSEANLVRLALDGNIDVEHRVRSLCQYIKEHGELPGGCSSLFHQRMALRILRGWDVPTYEKLWEQIPSRGKGAGKPVSRGGEPTLTDREAFAQKLLLCDATGDRAAPREALAAIVKDANDDLLVCALVQSLGEQESVELGPKLHGCVSSQSEAIWGSLPFARGFPRRLAALCIAKGRGLVKCGEDDLREWGEVEDFIKTAERDDSKRSWLSWRRNARFNERAKRLAQLFKKLPVGEHRDFDTVQARGRCLKNLASQYDRADLGDSDFVRAFEKDLKTMAGGSRHRTGNTATEGPSHPKSGRMLVSIVLTSYLFLIPLSALSLAALLGYKPAIQFLTTRHASWDSPMPPDDGRVNSSPEDDSADGTVEARQSDEVTPRPEQGGPQAALVVPGAGPRTPDVLVAARSPMENLDYKSQKASTGITLRETDLGENAPIRLDYDLAVHGFDQLYWVDDTREYLPSVIRNLGDDGLTALMTIKTKTASGENRPAVVKTETFPLAAFSLRRIAPQRCDLSVRLDPLALANWHGKEEDLIWCQGMLGLSVLELRYADKGPFYVALRKPEAAPKLEIRGGKTSIKKAELLGGVDSEFRLGRGTIRYTQPAATVSFGGRASSADKQLPVSENNEWILPDAGAALGFEAAPAASGSGSRVENVKVRLQESQKEDGTVILDFAVDTVPSSEELDSEYEEKFQSIDRDLTWFQERIDRIKKNVKPPPRPHLRPGANGLRTRQDQLKAWQDQLKAWQDQLRAGQELVDWLVKNRNQVLAEKDRKFATWYGGLSSQHFQELMAARPADLDRAVAFARDKAVAVAAEHVETLNANRNQLVEENRTVQIDIARVRGAASVQFELYRMVGEKIAAPVWTIPNAE